jgi:hypothetical protein
MLYAQVKKKNTTPGMASRASQPATLLQVVRFRLIAISTSKIGTFA